MHSLQLKLLSLLSQRKDINYIKNLRAIGRMLEVSYPQNIKHHLKQLEKKGLVKISDKTGEVKLIQKVNNDKVNFFSLPIVGMANCGQPNAFADENIEDYLKVSKKALRKKSAEGLFVVRASGDSLNMAKNIEGGAIENGDYVIINKNKAKPEDGDYILSIIDGLANLKRFYEDKKNKEIKLVSESNLNTPPIILHKEDLDNFSYFMNGVVVRVVKS